MATDNLPRDYYSFNVRDDASQLITRGTGTPFVRLNRVTRGCVATVVAKQEMFLPTSSNKDRAAWKMIENAERRDSGISPGRTTFVEPTSGSMGISLAFMAAVKGYKAKIIMPANTGTERRMAIKAFGADLILTDAEAGIAGAIWKAKQIRDAAPDQFVLLEAFNNPDNTKAHEETTGPEIWYGTNHKVDIFVMGIGTGGTISGVAKYLKSKNPNVKIYGVEPAESNVYNGGNPGSHGIIGIGTGSKSELVDEALIERVIEVTTEDALTMARRLACEEGLLVGIASGANTVAALKLAQMPENGGKLIVTIHTSCGERYFSTPLYTQLKEEVENMEPVPVPVPVPDDVVATDHFLKAAF